jgi:hypothetical protein
MRLPVLHRSSSSRHAIAITPAEVLAASIARFTSTGSLPRKTASVGFRITNFGACSAFTHVMACLFAKSPR